MHGNDGEATAGAGGAAGGGDDLDIPLSVLVRCPLIGFKLRAVGGHCPECPHFRGLSDRLPVGKHPFHARYAVLCAAEPTRRELFEVEIDEAR